MGVKDGKVAWVLLRAESGTRVSKGMGRKGNPSQPQLGSAVSWTGV